MGVPATITASVTSTFTSSITLLTTSNTAQTPRSVSQLQKRNPSYLASLAAEEVLFVFGPTLPRAICIELLYGGVSSKAPAPVSRTTTITRSTTVPAASITNTVTSSASAPTSTVTTKFSTTPPPVTSTVTLSASTSTTIYQTIAPLATDSAAFCGPDADVQGCSCQTGTDGLSVTCEYAYVGVPAMFTSPCYGMLAATLQGGSGGYDQFAYTSGSSVESTNVGSFTINRQFNIRVGGDGQGTSPIDLSQGGFAYQGGAGGYNGGGLGGSDFPTGKAGGGGGGATDLFLQGAQSPLLAAGGAGGAAAANEGNVPTSGQVSQSPAPQGGNGQTNSNPVGGGGGGGYPGGAAGNNDGDAGYAGTSVYSINSDTYLAYANGGGASATLTFRCEVH